MKALFILPTILLLFFSSATFAQKSKKSEVIVALKLKKKANEELKECPKYKPFKISDVGILTATEGFEIIYSEKTGRYIIQRKSAKIRLTENQDNFDIETCGGIVIICHCGFGAGDDCEFYPVPQGSDVEKHCGGTCACGSTCWLEDEKDVAEYQTMNGDWH